MVDKSIKIIDLIKVLFAWITCTCFLGGLLAVFVLLSC